MENINFQVFDGNFQVVIPCFVIQYDNEERQRTLCCWQFSVSLLSRSLRNCLFMISMREGKGANAS